MPSGLDGRRPARYGGCTSDDPYRLGIWCYASESERDEILGAIIGGVIAGAILAVAAAVVAPVAIAVGSPAVVAAPLTIVSSLSRAVSCWSARSLSPPSATPTPN